MKVADQVLQLKSCHMCLYIFFVGLYSISAIIVIGAFQELIRFPALGCVPSCGHAEHVRGVTYYPKSPPAGAHVSMKHFYVEE